MNEPEEFEEQERPRRSKKEQNRKHGSSNPVTSAYGKKNGADFHRKQEASQRFQKHKRSWHCYQDLEDDYEE